MSTWRRIKADRVTLRVDEKLRTWTVAWGGPLAVTPDGLEILFAHATQLDPDGELLTIMPRFFEQIIGALRRFPHLGHGRANEAEFVGIELSTAGEHLVVFLGVQVSEGALSLFAPTDLEDAS